MVVCRIEEEKWTVDHKGEKSKLARRRKNGIKIINLWVIGQFRRIFGEFRFIDIVKVKKYLIFFQGVWNFRGVGNFPGVGNFQKVCLKSKYF